MVYYDYRGGNGQFSQTGGGTHGKTKTHTALYVLILAFINTVGSLKVILKKERKKKSLKYVNQNLTSSYTSYMFSSPKY